MGNNAHCRVASIDRVRLKMVDGIAKTLDQI